MPQRIGVQGVTQGVKIKLLKNKEILLWKYFWKIAGGNSFQVQEVIEIKLMQGVKIF